MAEVTKDLINGILKQLQDRMSSFEKKMDELKGEMQAMRIHLVGMHQDIKAIYSAFARRESRLDRIGRRLEISRSPA